MVLNFITVALVLFIAYMWSIRGFYSSFLQMVAVIVAGAIAFAFWEPISLWLLNVAPEKGMLKSVGGNAWMLGLLIPFIVSLVIVRVIFDKTLRANVALTTLANYIGGGICGLVTGTLTVGILVIALGNLWYTDSTMGMGYRPVWYTSDRATGGGSLVYDDKLWIPADKLTAKFYGHLSRAAFFSPEPLDKWHPEIEIEGPAARITYANGNARNTVRPEDVSLQGVYVVGSDRNTPARDLLSYEGGTKVQKYTDLSGNPVSTGQLFGIKFKLEAGAKDSTAQHMIGPGQVRLVVQPVDASGKPTGEPGQEIFPVALISQGDSSQANSYGRWRFEAEGVHISSVGGGASSTMAAEFLVPPGVQPIAVYVKGVRLKLDQNTLSTATKFANAGMRDAQVSAGTILKSTKAEDLDKSMAFTIDGASIGGRGSSSMVTMSSRLGREAFQSSAKRGLELDDKKEIVSGKGTWTPQEVSKGRDISSKLKVDRFAVPPGTLLLQIDVSPTTKASLLGDVGSVADEKDPFYLIDTQGTLYQAVGYIYKDRERYDIRYFPGRPLRGQVDLDVPGLTNVRDDQKLKLIFLISRNVELEAFAIGDKVVFEVVPPRLMKTR